MDQLSEIPDLRQSPTLLAELRASGTIKRCRRGDILIQDSSYIASVPIVLDGALKVMQRDEEDREILLYHLQAGETCVMAVLGGLFGEPSKVRAVCEEDCEVLMVPVTRIGPLLREHPAWINYIFRMYHQRFEELLDVVNAVAFKKMDTRLMELLQRKAEVSGSRTLAVTHESLSVELGTARAVISRLLKQMESEGLVELGRNRLILRN